MLSGDRFIYCGTIPNWNSNFNCTYFHSMSIYAFFSWYVIALQETDLFVHFTRRHSNSKMNNIIIQRTLNDKWPLQFKTIEIETIVELSEYFEYEFHVFTVGFEFLQLSQPFEIRFHNRIILITHEIMKRKFCKIAKLTISGYK